MQKQCKNLVLAYNVIEMIKTYLTIFYLQKLVKWFLIKYLNIAYFIKQEKKS